MKHLSAASCSPWLIAGFVKPEMHTKSLQRALWAQNMSYVVQPVVGASPQSVVGRLVFTAEFDVRTVEKSWMSKNGLYLFLEWSFPRLTNHKDERDVAEVEDFKLLGFLVYKGEWFSLMGL